MAYIAPEDSVFGVGFLDRLKADAQPRMLTQAPDVNDVLESIKRNVSHILNSRVGGAESAPLLGLIDFNDATLESMDLSVRIKLAIQHCLERYEPRLKNIYVKADSDLHNSMILRFYITADLNSAALSEQICLSLLLDNNGKYRVY